MSWASAVRAPTKRTAPPPPPVGVFFPTITPANVDWDRLVSLDFETFFDSEYTLKKLSTSEYVRDPRFTVHMVGI